MTQMLPPTAASIGELAQNRRLSGSPFTVTENDGRKLEKEGSKVGAWDQGESGNGVSDRTKGRGCWIGPRPAFLLTLLSTSRIFHPSRFLSQGVEVGLCKLLR